MMVMHWLRKLVNVQPASAARVLRTVVRQTLCAQRCYLVLDDASQQHPFLLQCHSGAHLHNAQPDLQKVQTRHCRLGGVHRRCASYCVLVWLCVELRAIAGTHGS